MTTLQNFVVFCLPQHESVIGKCIPSLLSLPPISLSPTPQDWYKAPVWVSWGIQQIPVGYLFYIWKCKFPCYSLHTSHPLLPPPHVHKSILYVYPIINSSVPFFYIPYICIRIQYLYFSFWFIPLCIIGSMFIHLIRTDSNVFLSMAE